jgi:hypothetical protein
MPREATSSATSPRPSARGWHPGCSPGDAVRQLSPAFRALRRRAGAGS